MANSVRNLNLDLETLGGLLISKLGLSSDQQKLLEELIDNKAIDAPTLFEIVRLNFKGGDNVAPTDFDDINIALSVDASAGFQLGLYPSGADIVLAGFTLPKFHRAQRSFPVTEGHVACGLELSATVGAGAKATGGTGMTLGLSANGSLDTTLRFIKEMPATRSRDAIVQTLAAFSTPFNVLQRPPGPGEAVVAEYHGLLKLGATFDYGWSTSGTKKLGTGLDNLELDAEYKANAKLGVNADFSVENQFAVIVRGTGQDQWVNVSFMKLNEHDAGVALNLAIDASLHTSTGSGQDLGVFVDSLLSRTRIPDLMAELQKYDTPEKVRQFADENIDHLVDRITGDVQGILEGPVAELSAFLQPVRDKARELVDAYTQFDAEDRSFLENALEKVDSLADIEAAAKEIAGMRSVDELISRLGNSADADKIRQMLDISSQTLGFDLSQVSWLTDNFDRLRELSNKIVNLDTAATRSFEQVYDWFKQQLYIDQVVDRLETIDKFTAQGLLDRKILWLETYLSDEVGKPIDQLIDHLDPVIKALNKITTGYNVVVGKAKRALEQTLNQEIGLQASLAWQSLSSFQALVSVDLNLAEQAGRDAVKVLMRGDIHTMMRHRLTQANAIRFQKSYFLDEISRSITLKVVLNGRQDLRVKTALAASHMEIQATDNGEIWVQESSAQTTFQRTNRRAMININTLFQVSLRELFLRHDSDLVGQGATVGQYSISYTLHREMKQGESTAEQVVGQLGHLLAGIDFQVVNAAEVSSLRHDLMAVGKLGALGNAAVDIRVYLAPDALHQAFSGSSVHEFESLITKAWDQTVKTAYAGQPALLHFYNEFKNNAGGIPQFGTQGAAPLNFIQWQDASNVINSRGTFSDILMRLYQKVFNAVEQGDRIALELHNRFQAELKKSLKRLAKKMRWINSFEHENNERDFAMSVFANMVSQSDRSGSIVVTYIHPISKQTMTLRVDEQPRMLES